MREEERRYDEAAQLCRAAEDLGERIQSLLRRLGDRDGDLSRAELEAAEQEARSALEHLRRYRERLVAGAPPEVSAG